jgi:PKD repeat protein
MLENYGYSNIIGNSNAPHINALVSDPNAALFTQSFALAHPSQPNYIRLFSGNHQGITTDAISTSTPFSTCNLGASLISSGHTFAGYSEDLPSVGSLATTSGSYARKHCPWTNWQGTGTNRLPASVGQKFSSFPISSAYSTLPTVSFVIPNLNDDMHNPTFPTPNYSVTAISNGDTWVYNNLTNYINWAKANNSLLILTFDEDDGGSPNKITTIFIGQMVQGGSYSTPINHYNLLRTIEDMYSLPHCDSSAYVAPITNVWKSHPVANFSASATTVCAGQSIALTDNSTNTPTAWTWTMANGAPSSSTLQNPSVTFANAGTYTISLVATNSAGSSSSFSKTITVNANPVIPIITLTGSALTSSSTSSNQWYLNGAAISGAVNQTYTTTANGSYTVTVTNTFGCSGTSIATNITTNNPPVPSFTASTTNCEGQAIALTDNSTNGPTSWHWTLTGGSPASSNTQNPSVTYSTAGTYTATLIATNSSGSSIPVSHTIIVNTVPPSPTITANGVILTSSIASRDQWYLNGVSIPGDTVQTDTATQSGFYKVIATNIFGCSTSSVPVNITTTNISTNINTTVLTLFPNPSNGIVTLNFAGKSEHIILEVFNGLGQLVYDEKINDCQNNCSETIDISAFHKGIYLFKIIANGISYTKNVLLIK